jgi:hypothetical protein
MRHPDTQTVDDAQPGANGSQVQGSQVVAQSSAQIGTQTNAKTGTQSGVANTSNPKKGAKRGRKKKNDDAMGTQYSTKKQ